MKIIITEDKFQELSQTAEKMLKYGGRLMTCLESLEDEGGYGERGGNSGGMGMRDDEDWDDTEMGMRRERFGMRQGVKGTGRYSRYR